MSSVNEVKQLVRKLPALNQVADWIEQAKELPRVIQYYYPVITERYINQDVVRFNTVFELEYARIIQSSLRCLRKQYFWSR